MAELDRAFALKLGHLVQAAYDMWEVAKTLPAPQHLTPPPPDNFPGGYTMNAWIQMADFAFGSQEPQFYGFIAVDPNGRTVLVIRGTEGWIEWYDDAVAWLTPFRQVPTSGHVSVGFDKIYSTLNAVKYTPEVRAMVVEAQRPAPPLEGTFVQQVEQVLDAATARVPRSSATGSGPGAGRLVLDVTGHSLGAALCTLYALDHAVNGNHKLSTICTFASPRVGNTDFVGAYDKLTISSWRIANQQDIVTKVPPFIPLILDYKHVNRAYEFSSAGVTKFNPSCWHDMRTYLHYLDSSELLKDGCSN